MMMVAASPTYNYTFLFSHKVCSRVMHIVLSHTRHAQPSNTFSTLRCLCTLASSLLFARCPCACMTVTPMRGLGGIHVRVCVHVYEHSLDRHAFSKNTACMHVHDQTSCMPSFSTALLFTHALRSAARMRTLGGTHTHATTRAKRSEAWKTRELKQREIHGGLASMSME